VPLLLAALIAGGCRGPVSDHGTAEPPPPRPSAVKPFGMGTPDAVLLVTGGTCGWMEMCNCTGQMPGGLARRSGLARSYRAVFPHVALLDLGDVFWVEPKEIRNRFVMRGYAQIGYDAVVLGHHEWAAHPQPLAEIISTSNVPCFSTTVFPAEPPKDWRVRKVFRREWGRVKLAVVSELKRPAMLFFPPETLDRLRFSPDGELARLVAALKREGFVVVVAVPMMDEEVDAVAQTVPADLFLRGHTVRSDPRVRRVAGRPVLKIGGKETVGAVALKIASAGRDTRITDLELRLELVDTRWPMDKRLIQTYQAYAHAAMREALDRERKKGLDYVPSAACGQCHRPQYEQWRRSRHAGAYRTLVRAGRTGDPNCMACHTTGFGTEKGFYTFAKTPDLAGVNCQDCHRFTPPEHQKDGRGLGFKFPRVTDKICTTCHTPVTDPHFASHNKLKLPKVRCPRTPR
jgi:hypothetical protein